jgi:hypothetical protein
MIVLRIILATFMTLSMYSTYQFTSDLHKVKNNNLEALIDATLETIHQKENIYTCMYDIRFLIGEILNAAEKNLFKITECKHLYWTERIICINPH